MANLTTYDVISELPQAYQLLSRQLILFLKGCFIMRVENNPDFKTVWQLAHDWVGEEIDKTDPNAISPELRLAIDRLMRAISCKEITGRWKGYRIFMDESFLSTIFDLGHSIRFFIWARFNSFSKYYLDNLYVKRNEVIIWCDKILLLDPPPCWSHKKLTAIYQTKNELIDPDDENNSWYDKITERRRQRVTCIELAKQLWKIEPELSYDKMKDHNVMRKFGYSSTFSAKQFKNLVRIVASESAQSPGAPMKSEE